MFNFQVITRSLLAKSQSHISTLKFISPDERQARLIAATQQRNASSMQPDVNIRKLTAGDQESALEFLRSFSFRDEPINQAVALLDTPNSRCEELEEYTTATIRHGVSLGAFDKRMNFVGIALNGVLRKTDADWAAKWMDCPNPKFRQILQVRRYLDREARVWEALPRSCDTVLDLRMVSTHREWRGKGIMKLLCQESERIAKSIGACATRMDATSAFSAAAAESLMYKKLYGIPYKDIPFAPIPKPPHCEARVYIKKLQYTDPEPKDDKSSKEDYIEEQPKVEQHKPKIDSVKFTCQSVLIEQANINHKETEVNIEPVQIDLHDMCQEESLEKIRAKLKKYEEARSRELRNQEKAVQRASSEQEGRKVPNEKNESHLKYEEQPKLDLKTCPLTSAELARNLFQLTFQEYSIHQHKALYKIGEEKISDKIGAQLQIGKGNNEQFKSNLIYTSQSEPEIKRPESQTRQLNNLLRQRRTKIKTSQEIKARPLKTLRSVQKPRLGSKVQLNKIGSSPKRPVQRPRAPTQTHQYLKHEHALRMADLKPLYRRKKMISTDPNLVSNGKRDDLSTSDLKCAYLVTNGNESSLQEKHFEETTSLIHKQKENALTLQNKKVIESTDATKTRVNENLHKEIDADVERTPTDEPKTPVQ